MDLGLVGGREDSLEHGAHVCVVTNVVQEGQVLRDVGGLRDELVEAEGQDLEGHLRHLDHTKTQIGHLSHTHTLTYLENTHTCTIHTQV